MPRLRNLSIERALLASVVGLATGCLPPTSNFKDPGPGTLPSESTTGGASSSQTAGDSQDATGGDDTWDSDPTTTSPGSTTATTTSTTTTGDDDDTTDDGPPDTACLVKAAYGDLGKITDGRGVYRGYSEGHVWTAAETYLTPTDPAGRDTVEVVLWSNYYPFDDFPNARTIGIEGTPAADPAQCGACVYLHADARIDGNGQLNSQYSFLATSGTLTLTRIDDAMQHPQGQARVAGTIEGAVFTQLSTSGFEPGGCISQLQRLEFDIVIDTFDVDE